VLIPAADYPASEPVESGDIVAADPLATSTATGMVKKALFGDAAIGVVSTNPAISIEGSSLEFLAGTTYRSNPSRPAIALSGRVPVKVTTEGGAIRVGDRITASSLAGFGMKATTSGVSVGIALAQFEPTTDNQQLTTTPHGDIVATGTVMVFVNLGYSKLDSGNDDGLSLASYASLSTSSGALPTWAIDSKTGEIKGGSYVDMKGADMVNVRSILSQNGTWSIDEDGVITAKEIRVARVETEELAVGRTATVGTTDKPIGITLFDVYDKMPKCLTIVAGVVNAADGATNSPQDGSTGSPQGGGGSSTGGGGGGNNGNGSSQTSTTSQPQPSSETSTSTSTPTTSTVETASETSTTASPPADQTSSITSTTTTIEQTTPEPAPNTAPAITILGANPLELTVEDSFVEPGATARDAEDGDISGQIVYGGMVDTSTAGTYTLTYNVSDFGGLSAPEAARIVNVNALIEPVETASSSTTPATP